MKKITKKQKILSVIIAVIVIAGAIVTGVKGLNYDLRYQETKNIELYIAKDFEIADIKAITDEVMGKSPVIIRKVEVYEDSVSITAKDITDEQKQSIIEKINERYETELSADSTQIETIPHTRGRDIAKPYIIPFIISTVIILVYMAIRYRKIGILKTLLTTISTSVAAQAVLLSIIAITRIPVGRLTIPMIVTVYMLTLVGLTTNFEKKLEIKKEEEKQK
ncbi:MAG: hypothetical protein V8R81_03005 [Clostridia bacterium]